VTRRALAFGALGAAAYAVFLAATAPASLVAYHLNDHFGAVVRLSDAKGTVWSGTARALVAAGGAAPIVVDDVHWNWQAARLPAGEISFAAAAEARELSVRLETARGFSGLEARKVTARLDAARLPAFAPLAAPWQPGGTIALSAPRILWNGRALAGEAQLEWRGATAAISDVSPLGSWRAAVRASPEGGVRFTVSTLEGPLAVKGSGTFHPPARLAFSGEARGEGERAAALAPLLALLGPRRPDGAHAIQWASP
jgi:general secretion pathway protein N